jgi:hypothetical protein
VNARHEGEEQPREQAGMDSHPLPHAGAALVFRRQMRARSWYRDMLWAGCVLIGLLIASAILQKTWAQINLFHGDAPGFLTSWLTMGAIGACGVFLPLGSILGAGAVPNRTETPGVQELLLTRLSAGAICTGRLAATLWPLAFALLLSGLFWSAAQIRFAFVEGAAYGLAPIWEAHAVVACATYMVSAVAFLGALRNPPGRAWGRGIILSLLMAGGCVTALFVLDPLILRMAQPQRLIEGALLINPVSATAVSLGLDILRTDWLYTHTSAPEYLFAYPSPLVSAGAFVLIALAAQWLSAWRLHRIYR